MMLFSITLAFVAFTGVLSNKLLFSNSSYLRVRVVTWSVNKKNLPDVLLDLVGLNETSQSNGPDIIAVGLQNLGYFDNAKDDWIKTLKLTATGYYTVQTKVSKGNALVILAKVSISSSFNSTLNTRDVSLQLFSKVGGIITHFTLFSTQFTFVCLRLSEKAKADRRTEQYKEVKKNMEDKKDPSSDYVFWFGNFNFKIDLEPYTAKPLIETKNWTILLLHDELKKVQQSRQAFEGLKEQNMNFRPSYKFQPSLNEYDWTMTPSWADRILYSSKKNSTITPVKYELIEKYRKTEHKPVLGDFIVTLNCPVRYRNLSYPCITNTSLSSRPIL